MSATCSIDGCETAAFARNMCVKHYTRWRRTGDATSARAKLPDRHHAVCTVEGCDRPHVAKGLCEMHRWRMRTHGDTGPATNIKKGRQPKPPAPCSVEGCERDARTMSLCSLHYERQRRGKPLGPPGLLIRPKGSGVIHEGYIRIRTPDGRRIMEHVWAMEQHLGRELLPGENVHHKNGDKQDNRLSNLELWVTMQPTGQRPEDLLAYAQEIIDRYGGGEWRT